MLRNLSISDPDDPSLDIDPYDPFYFDYEPRSCHHVESIGPDLDSARYVFFLSFHNNFLLWFTHLLRHRERSPCLTSLYTTDIANGEEVFKDIRNDNYRPNIIKN